MGTKTIPKKSFQEQLLDYVYTKRRLVFSLAFIVALFLPISSTRLGNLRELTEQSVMKWVVALNTFYANLFSTFTVLINTGIERTILFFQNMVDFFSQLIQFDLGAISEAGYLLTALYFIIPVLFILSVVLFVLNYMNRSNLFKLLSPKKLIVLLLIIPLTDDFLWLGAIVAIFLSFYWYIDNLQQEKSENTNLSHVELISWKKTILLGSVIIIFAIAILSHYI